MNTVISITLADLGWLLIGTALFIMLIYIIILIRNFIPVAKKLDKILEDVEEITDIASQSTKNVQSALNNLTESAGILSDAIKNNQNIVTALTSLFNAITALKNIIHKIFN